MDNTHTELGRFHSDGQWFSDHYDELAKKYPDQWVAVYVVVELPIINRQALDIAFLVDTGADRTILSQSRS